MQTHLGQLNNSTFYATLHRSQPRDSYWIGVHCTLLRRLAQIHYGQTMPSFSALLRSPLHCFTLPVCPQCDTLTFLAVRPGMNEPREKRFPHGARWPSTALRVCAACSFSFSSYQRPVDAVLRSRYLEADFDDLLNLTGSHSNHCLPESEVRVAVARPSSVRAVSVSRLPTVVEKVTQTPIQTENASRPTSPNVKNQRSFGMRALQGASSVNDWHVNVKGCGSSDRGQGRYP